MSKDWNKLAQFEKAIADKYGKEAIQDPRSNWDEIKENSYKEQLKKLSEKEYLTDEKDDKVEQDGFLISKKLLNRETTKRVCPVCRTYSFKIRDDVFMNKFECCYSCYIDYVDGREDRWLSGWRPSDTKLNKENQ